MGIVKYIYPPAHILSGNTARDRAGDSMKPEHELIAYLNEQNLYHLREAENDPTRTQRIRHEQRSTAYCNILQWIRGHTDWDEVAAAREARAVGGIA